MTADAVRGEATVVVSEAVTAPEALAAVARTAGTSVRDSGTPRAHVVLTADAVATVETPKFGEAPPLSVDVSSRIGQDDARALAEWLARDLAALAGWTTHVIAAAPSSVRSG